MPANENHGYPSKREYPILQHILDGILLRAPRVRRVVLTSFVTITIASFIINQFYAGFFPIQTIFGLASSVIIVFLILILDNINAIRKLVDTDMLRRQLTEEMRPKRYDNMLAAREDIFSSIIEEVRKHPRRTIDIKVVGMRLRGLIPLSQVIRFR